MWSQPDIRAINERAAKDEKKLVRSLSTLKVNGKPLECECKDWGSSHCSGPINAYPWYDIFSDKPKGILALCQHHDNYSGSPCEGYFTCDDCGRVFIENYTWEYYHTMVGDELLCLPCAAKRYINDDKNWIELTPKNIKATSFGDVCQAKHVIGVDMPVPKQLEFIDCVTFDSSSGGRVTGGMSCDPTPDSGVRELHGYLTQAMNNGHKRALLILDGGYQFAVRIGVYVDSPACRKPGPAERAIA